jgi:hypothetical protein
LFDATAVSFWSEKVRKRGLKEALYEGKKIGEVKGRGMTTPCISERHKPIVSYYHCSLNKDSVNGLFTYLCW